MSKKRSSPNKDFGRKERQFPVDFTVPMYREGATFKPASMDVANSALEKLFSMPTELERPTEWRRYPTRPIHSASLRDHDD